MPRFVLSAVLLCMSLVAPIEAQRLVTDQKTIEISATEKVVVPADIATVKIGYQNQAPTKDAAYAENTRTTNKILQAILDAGVPKEAIETESLRLDQEPRNRSVSRRNQINLSSIRAIKNGKFI